MVHIALTENPSKKPNILIKELPRSIEKRLSILLSSKNIFQESTIYSEKMSKKQWI